jgi:DNA-binding XRE family transcriptional regulator
MDSASGYNQEFIGRTKQARERSGFTTSQMAQLLNVRLDTYLKYESRTPLPRSFVPNFCLLCRVSADWLFGEEHPFPGPQKEGLSNTTGKTK